MKYLKNEPFSIGVNNPRYDQIFKKKIVFDLDGVLRDLNGYLHTKLKIPQPEKWFWEYKDKDIYKWIEHDSYRALVYAMPTKYYWVIKDLPELEIWTCQPKHWQPYTKIWLGCNLPQAKVKYLNTEQKEKSLYSKSNIYLVEDSPRFKNYERILLIDLPYNQHVRAKHRIKNINKLKRWIGKKF